MEKAVLNTFMVFVCINWRGSTRSLTKQKLVSSQNKQNRWRNTRAITKSSQVITLQSILWPNNTETNENQMNLVAMKRENHMCLFIYSSIAVIHGFFAVELVFVAHFCENNETIIAFISPANIIIGLDLFFIKEIKSKIFFE